MDKTLKNRKNRKNKSGSATVEFLLLIPVFLCVLGFSNMLGQLSRTFSYGNSVGADMLRYNTGSDYQGLHSERSGGNMAAEDVTRMWKVNNPDGQLEIKILDMQSSNTTYSGTFGQLTTQNSLAYTSDMYSLYEESEHLKKATATVNGDTGEVTIVITYTREGKILQRFGNVNDFEVAAELLNERSTHRSVIYELDATPWMRKIIPEDFDAEIPQAFISEGSSYQHHRDPNFESTNWRVFQDADSFHGALENLMGDMTLDIPPDYSGALKPYQTSESLSTAP
jgi:Flp pilus assembly protein TadG